MVRVFINGYGNIGKRLASAFSHDKEIQFVGIGKYSIDDRVDEAFAKKFAVYVPEQKYRTLDKRVMIFLARSQMQLKNLIL